MARVHGENHGKRERHVEGGRAHVKTNTWSVTRKLLDERVCVQLQCSVHQFQHNFVQYDAKSLLSTSPTRNKVRFLYGDPKTQKSARAQGRAWLYLKSLEFRHVPQPRIRRMFQNPRHASTTEVAIQPSQEVAHTTPVELKRHDLSD